MSGPATHLLTDLLDASWNQTALLSLAYPGIFSLSHMAGTWLGTGRCVFAWIPACILLQTPGRQLAWFPSATQEYTSLSFLALSFSTVPVLVVSSLVSSPIPLLFYSEKTTSYTGLLKNRSCQRGGYSELSVLQPASQPSSVSLPASIPSVYLPHHCRRGLLPSTSG